MHDLGYCDLVPARRGGRATQRGGWRPTDPLRGGTEEKVLTDPFDYAAEDALIVGVGHRPSSVESSLATDPFVAAPGYGLAYSGPGGRARSTRTFDP